jgi:hypothetical protein
MSVKHTIRTKTGFEEVTLTPLTAIVRNCLECLGFDEDPELCTSPKCALFPFRKGDAHSGKTMTEQGKEAARLRLAAMRNKNKGVSALPELGK